MNYDENKARAKAALRPVYEAQRAAQADEEARQAQIAADREDRGVAPGPRQPRTRKPKSGDASS